MLFLFIKSPNYLIGSSLISHERYIFLENNLVCNAMFSVNSNHALHAFK